MASGVTVTNTMADNDYDSAMDKAIEASLETAGVILERQATQLTAVDTGRLRGSITYRSQRKQSRVRAPASGNDQVSRPGRKWTLHVGTNVEYAAHLEYGTRKMSAQPYLRPALTMFKHEILRDFSKWVEKFLKRGK